MANPNFKENKLKRAIAKTLQPILRMVSKRLYVSLQYRYITGHKLNWNKLERYTEKLQYLRLYVYPKNPKVIQAAGRVGARELVKSKGYSDLLIPIYGVYQNFAQIKFAKLPDEFVIKASHASGYNYICHNKNSLDLKMLEKYFTKCLKTNYGKKTVEPHYNKIKPSLIIEKYIGEGDALPVEYKIHCFNGKARYLYVVTNRGQEIRYNNFYIDWTPFNDAQFNHWKTSKQKLKAPKNFDLMVEIAEKLSEDFPFVRIDLYNVDGKIYFSEFTFTPAKGTLIFENEKADYEIGSWLDIKKINKN